MNEVTKETLKRANVCMRRDSFKASQAATALCVALQLRETVGEVISFATDFLRGDKVAIEYLNDGISMATWSDVRLRARLATIRANSRA